MQEFVTYTIPQSIRILPKYKFKVSLHQFFLHILELEDIYVDTPTLVNKLSKMNVKYVVFVTYCNNSSSSLYVCIDLFSFFLILSFP